MNTFEHFIGVANTQAGVLLQQLGNGQKGFCDMRIQFQCQETIGFFFEQMIPDGSWGIFHTCTRAQMSM